MEAKASYQTGSEKATLGGGCFWCLEAVFNELKGVEKVVSGYTGGRRDNPTYREVCQGNTGHAEVVQITYNPKIISFKEILEVFFATHDPTTLNRQGADTGTQYRSAIFAHDPDQETIARQLIKELDAEQIWPNPIVTEVVPLTTFFAAEEYHQSYFTNNPEQPYCLAVVSPKVSKFRKRFSNKLKS